MKILKKIVLEKKKRNNVVHKEIGLLFPKIFLYLLLFKKNSGRGVSILILRCLFYMSLVKQRESLFNLKNYCFLSGRSRGVNKHFGLSRLKIRENFKRGYLYGVRKISW